MKRWFGKRPTRALEILRGAEWTCNSCEIPHVGMFDMAAIAPDPWPHAREYEPNSTLRMDGDFLSEDFCVIDGKHFMIRCVLEIPVHGLIDKFAYGCLGTLKRENFDAYVDGFDEGIFLDAEPWWSWLCDRPRPYMTADEDYLGCWMFPQPSRQRPVLRVDDPGHPLGIAQEHGVEPEDILAIYDAYGHGVL